MAHSIDFVVETEPEGVDLAALEALAGRVLEGEGVADGVALAVLTTDDETLRDLNSRFLGIDAPTDVLAFPEAAEAPLGEGEAPSLGEIAISVPTAVRQALELNHPLADELAHLLTHGILHLCGYDHEAGGEEAARMRAREERYLGDIRGHDNGGVG
ncbi:MAG: rRNA maturation RNase YbeY [Dehalococcoidia bacterium]|nr:rRNA maturation RNase YbeY [Dehalococcoidia bacterium]